MNDLPSDLRQLADSLERIQQFVPPLIDLADYVQNTDVSTITAGDFGREVRRRVAEVYPLIEKARKADGV